MIFLPKEHEAWRKRGPEALSHEAGGVGCYARSWAAALKEKKERWDKEIGAPASRITL